MNEPLLKVMIELLAMLSNIENLSSQKLVLPFAQLQENLEEKIKNLMARKSLVQWYLNQEISAADMPKYIKIYDNLMESAYQISVEENQIEIAPFDYKRVYQLAELLNGGLNLRQKLMVFVRLMEYVLVDLKRKEKALPVFLILAEKLNINNEYVDDVLSFLTATENNIPPNNNLLFVDDTCQTNISGSDEDYKSLNAHGFRE